LISRKTTLATINATKIAVPHPALFDGLTGFGTMTGGRPATGVGRSLSPSELGCPDLEGSSRSGDAAGAATMGGTLAAGKEGAARAKSQVRENGVTP
jgi:hypothetical protein